MWVNPGPHPHPPNVSIAEMNEEKDPNRWKYIKTMEDDICWIVFLIVIGLMGLLGLIGWYLTWE